MMPNAEGRTEYKPHMAIVLVLIGAVVLSAMAVTYSVYRTRDLTIEVQHLREAQNRLNVAWGQLLLEGSTWGAYARVEKAAQTQLNMIHPAAEQRVVVSP